MWSDDSEATEGHPACYKACSNYCEKVQLLAIFIHTIMCRDRQTDRPDEKQYIVETLSDLK